MARGRIPRAWIAWIWYLPSPDFATWAFSLHGEQAGAFSIDTGGAWHRRLSSRIIRPNDQARMPRRMSLILLNVWRRNGFRSFNRFGRRSATERMARRKMGSSPRRQAKEKR